MVEAPSNLNPIALQGTALPLQVVESGKKQALGNVLSLARQPQGEQAPKTPEPASAAASGAQQQATAGAHSTDCA